MNLTPLVPWWAQEKLIYSEFDIGGSTILIADNSPNNLHVMESMLREFGCDVRVALDGEAAIKSVQACLPDLILLDVHMPKIDGFVACEKLKADESTRDIPIIFVTALTDEFNKVAGLKLGAVDSITKPIEFEELRTRIGVHLQLARNQESLQNQAEELRAINDAMMGREMRVLEHKREVNLLSRELGREGPYPEADEDDSQVAN